MITAKNFIRIDKFGYGEYNFIYNINTGYIIDENLKNIKKYQLLFKKIKSSRRQLDLMLVDSIFHNILADVVIEVLQNRIKTFKEYCDLKIKRSFFDTVFSDLYFEIKFKQFIQQLLFGNISFDVKNGMEGGDKNVYYLKNKKGELEYFSIYDKNHLIDILFNKLVLKINFCKSVLRKNRLMINFQIRFYE